MDTEGLRLFVRAAEKLNISASGRDLGLAPAVASARLAKLERDVGAELLHRSTRRVSLSVAGEQFLPYAFEILAQKDAALAALGHGEANVEGTIRFAAPSTFCQIFIAPLLREFLDSNPGVRLDLRLSDSRYDMIDSSFDLALRQAALSDSTLTARKLGNIETILCASPAYIESRGQPKTPESLSQHEFIRFRLVNDRLVFRRNDERIEVLLDQLPTRLFIDDGASQRFATIAGLGISVNATWNVQEALESGDLVRILPDFDIEEHAALWLVYPKSHVLTPKVRLLIDFLVERIGRSSLQSK